MSLSGAPDARAAHPAQAALVLVLAAPWLWPVAVGPTPTTLPWLFAMACAAVALLLALWLPLHVSRAARRAWVLAAALGSLIGLVQFAGYSAELAPWVNITAAGEAFGNLRQRNQFATLTNIGLVAVLAGLAMAPRPQARNPRWQLPLALVLVVVMAFANVASSSRTGLLQLGLVVVLAALWAPWRRPAVRSALGLAVAAYALAAFALPRMIGQDAASTGIVARLQDGAPACLSRITLWRNVLHLIGERPWTGWGWGSLDAAHFMAVYPGTRFCDILDNAHNLPLHLAVELGLPVALLLCGLGAWAVWRAQPWRETVPERQLAWAVLLLVFVHSLLEYPLWYGPFQIACALALVLLWRTPSAPEAAAAGVSPRPAPATRWITTGWAVAVLLALAYAAWDYRRISQIYLSPAQRAPEYRVATLEKLQASWLFARQVQFAELTTTRVTPANAQRLNAMAHRLLRFSPEPRVVEKIIDSALLLDRDEEAAVFLERFEAAYPQAHAAWVTARTRP